MSTSHYFDVKNAKEYGINAAILLQNLIFWIRHNKANKKNLRDGKTWTYNSVKAWAEQFPYMTRKQVRTALDLLRERNVILTGNYNEKTNDKTLWYALVDEPHWLALWGNDNAPDGTSVASEGKSYIGTDNLPSLNKTDSNSSVPPSAGTNETQSRTDLEIKKKPSLEIELELQSKKAEFAEHVYTVGGLIYTSEMLDRFIRTFSQPNGAKRPKLRWEIERTKKGWQTEDRLKMWADRNIDNIQCYLTTEVTRSIKEKRTEFAKTIEAFKDRYTREMLLDFYRWWGLPEAKADPKRLRWELETFWELGTKLADWKAREDKRKSSNQSYGKRESFIN